MKRTLLLACLCLSGSCGGEHPASPVAVSTVFSPTARLVVRIDSLNSTVAIPALSNVTFDASQSCGQKLGCAIDFGDGSSTTHPIATHTYASAGSFTVVLTVTASDGQVATDRQTVTVKSVQGAWFVGAFNNASQHYEARRFQIDKQDGLTARGTYWPPDGPATTLTGTLSGERSLHLEAANHSIALDGTVPGGVTDAPMSMRVSGGSANGQTLSFAPVATGPASSTVKAVLSIRYGTDSGSFALAGATPVFFDATQSTGDGLSHVIEFGDCTSAQGPLAVHVYSTDYPTCPDRYQVRATVIDRYGRSDTASQQVVLMRLDGIGITWDFQEGSYPDYRDYYLRFNHNGATARGTFSGYTERDLPFTATLTADRAIQIRTDDGSIQMTGTMQKDPSYFFVLNLSVRGGSLDGRTVQFRYHDVY